MFDGSTLPDHLEETDGGRARCRDCGVEGLRPIGHSEECEHERDWAVKQRSLSGDKPIGQSTFAGDIRPEGGVDR